MIGQNSKDKTQNQQKLVQLITDYVTAQIGSTENGKKYLKTLAERDPQKALNKLGSTHAEIKKTIEALPIGSEKYIQKDYEVMQAIAVMLTAYNGSKKDEVVAIEIIKNMSQQTPAPKGPAT